METRRIDWWPNESAHLHRPQARQYALERRNAACVRCSRLFGGATLSPRKLPAGSRTHTIRIKPKMQAWPTPAPTFRQSNEAVAPLLSTIAQKWPGFIGFSEGSANLFCRYSRQAFQCGKGPQFFRLVGRWH